MSTQLDPLYLQQGEHLCNILYKYLDRVQPSPLTGCILGKCADFFCCLYGSSAKKIFHAQV